MSPRGFAQVRLVRTPQLFADHDSLSTLSAARQVNAKSRADDELTRAKLTLWLAVVSWWLTVLCCAVCQVSGCRAR